MIHFKDFIRNAALAIVFAFTLTPNPGFAQLTTTTFTYQGNLKSSNAAASGAYDFKFRLYDVQTGGAQIGSEVIANGVTVNEGLFTLPLDFGSAFDGAARWLEIEVKTSGAGAYTLLSPRQPITPAPQAVYASKAGEATTATVAVTAQTAANGMPAGYSILGDSQTPPPGYTWTGETINHIDDQWIARANMSQSIESLKGVAIGNKFYVIADGYTAVLDTATNTWDNTLTAMPTNRSNTHSVGAIGGKIYAVGGSGVGGALATNEMYNPATDTWETKPPMLQASRFGGACVIGNKLYNIAQATIQCYDPVAETWSVLQNPPNSIGNYPAVTALNNKMYVFGSNTNIYIYDPASDDGSGGQSAWSTGATIPNINQESSAVALNGKIYLLGINGSNGVNYIYDPIANSWNNRKPMLTRRSSCAAVAIGNHIYAAGGNYFQGSIHFLKSTEQYTPEVRGYYVHIKD